MNGLDTYRKVITKEYPNAIVHIYRPELTEEERARRMKAVHDAAAELLKNRENPN